MAAKGLNAYSLAKAIPGMKQPTIYRILSGESKDPKTPTLKRIADYFRVSIDDLRGDGDIGAITGRFTALSPEAMEILAVWERLPADRQQAYKDFLFFEVFATEQMPWLRRGRPVKESYDQFEARMHRLAAPKHVKK